MIFSTFHSVDNYGFFQLHGNGSRAAFSGLVRERRVIYVLNASGDGKLLNEVPEEDCHLADWILVDSATGGRYFEQFFFHFFPLLACCYGNVFLRGTSLKITLVPDTQVQHRYTKIC